MFYSKFYNFVLIALVVIFIPVIVEARTIIEDYQLVVYGGEPEGVMAAVSAARSGVKTLLVMERDKPGGLMVYGGLNYLDLNYSPHGGNLNKGLFQEWHQRVGGQVAFGIDKAISVFQNMLASEKNIKVMNNTELIKIKKEKGYINSLILREKGKLIEVKASYFIDSSQEAHLAVRAGAPYFENGADIGLPERHMAVTLVLHIGNINYEGLVKAVKDGKFGPAHINHNHAWGFVRIGDMYKPHDKNIKLRGLNIVFEKNDKGQLEAYINSMLIFGVDPLDKTSLKDAYKRGKKEAAHVLAFLKKQVDGFERAVLMDFPQELYIREGRHILARYQLKTVDLLENKIFEDTVALASYPLDYQAYTPEFAGFVLFNPVVYGIPMRSLIPKNLKNVMVVGRSSGYSSLAAASARVLPTGMACGEAAGLITYYAHKSNLTYAEITDHREIIRKVQKSLGIYRDINYYEDFVDHIIEDSVVRPYLEELLSWGLVVAGYRNDFKLTEIIREKQFAYIIIKGLRQRQAPNLCEWVPESIITLSTNSYLTRDRAAMLLLTACGEKVLNMEVDEYYNKACQMDLISNKFSKMVPDNRLLTRREAYMLLGYFLRKFDIPESLKRFRGEIK
ncbi:FAD-dependent oxidoreductase [Halothermothrix orenii]|uniref:Uncharacterized protein n=1 Tax=Halothermothrix orenii (strain H 168 / OCM 544 / DSM 9562) TaxID=373903 RepID=B8CWA3_HALOH|nr:FAD-dependent oxidoreductase [Halothermothrix orenii]ACL69572.1 hypothetical protein Hore_08150 [Halothermothrix orenii H 168]